MIKMRGYVGEVDELVSLESVLRKDIHIRRARVIMLKREKHFVHFSIFTKHFYSMEIAKTLLSTDQTDIYKPRRDIWRFRKHP